MSGSGLDCRLQLEPTAAPVSYWNEMTVLQNGFMVQMEMWQSNPFFEILMITTDIW